MQAPMMEFSNDNGATWECPFTPEELNEIARQSVADLGIDVVAEAFIAYVYYRATLCSWQGSMARVVV